MYTYTLPTYCLQTRIDVDICFNNVLPVHNSRLLLAYARLDDRVSQLGRLVKSWAQLQKLCGRPQ